MMSIVPVSIPRIGIRGIAYHFDETAPIDTIPTLQADPELLAKFKKVGHERFAFSHVSITEQAVISARQTLDRAGMAAADIDAVVIGTSELRGWNRFPEKIGNEILLALGMNDILVVGVTIAGCANYASALRVARNMIAVDGYRNVLVIETNQVRGNLDRVVASSQTGAPAYILADGALSYIATTEAAEFSVLGMEQIVKPVDPAQADAATFITNNVGGFRHVTQCALDRAGVRREQITQVFFHNISLLLLRGLIDVTGFPLYKLFIDNVGRTSHVWGADNLIGLHDYCRAENPPSGALFMLLCQADTYYSAVVCQKL
ncbi:MAG TPA: hypothetical protein VEC35_24020 [Noviherbaspirillum sp.]|nr:hypothetical protein [Noviherbaspirillum sp.]